MDFNALCAAVWEAPVYLGRFTRREYTKAFREYAQRFGPAFMEAAREEAPSVLAERMLDALTQRWGTLRFWNRSAVRVNEKQMLVNYLSPMLLGLEDPACAELAEALRQAWAARWPKDAYRITEYATIQGGFRNVILGIDLAGKHIDED